MRLVTILFHNSRSGSRNATRPLSSPLTPLSSNHSSSGESNGFPESSISEACCNEFLELAKSAWVLRNTIIRPLDNPHHPTVVEITIESAQFLFDMHHHNLGAKIRKYSGDIITKFERKWNVQTIMQQDSVMRRYKRLAVFDMDSTLIQQEAIDEIARKAGVEAQVASITERAMNGELDFAASLRARCSLLRGVSTTVFEELRDIITLSPGAKELIRALKRLGYKTAVLSGGFTPLTSWLADQLGLNYAYANNLVTSADGSYLTGELHGEIVNAERKRDLVIQIAEREGIPLDQVVVVGDGANDLLMMGVAGLGVAFNAKPKVQLEAPATLNGNSLLDILYLLGLTREEQEELLR
jgi:phosphoserine phosphatase